MDTGEGQDSTMVRKDTDRTEETGAKEGKEGKEEKECTLRRHCVVCCVLCVCWMWVVVQVS